MRKEIIIENKISVPRKGFQRIINQIDHIW